MKNIIENLFAGLLEGSAISNGKKKPSGEKSEDFSSDISGFLLGDKNNILNTSKLETQENETKNVNDFTTENILKNSLNSKVNISIEGEKKSEKIEDKVLIKKFLAKTPNTNNHNSHSDQKVNYNILNTKTDVKKNNKILEVNNVNVQIQKLGIKKNVSLNINENLEKPKKQKKIKTFFKNYLNFNNAKNSNRNKKVLKLISSNNLNTEIVKISNEQKNNNIIIKNKFNESTDINTLEKSTTSLNSKSTNLNLNLDSPETEKNDNLNRSANNVLKNILDIKSNNVNQRIAEIFERNIKLGNNKFEIEIKPENLGKIEVMLEINGDNVEITLKVDNNSVATLLSESNTSLQKSFSSQGLNLSNLNLSYNNQNKFADENLKKEKKDISKKNIEEEESLDSKIEKHHKSNNLVYIKA
ncbi:MAG: hypothetical protein CFH34_00645 [Alphaproteobacteria bacterium MarineAlpha9_Bin4]|nr:MAG: hypothetical protein CFH34_00645 [Alphaproteobacteria bacterium MarineAlpha9_Bin4]